MYTLDAPPADEIPADAPIITLDDPVAFLPALNPTNTLLWAVVNVNPASWPIAVLFVPVVRLAKALVPTATVEETEVDVDKAPLPMATLEDPVAHAAIAFRPTATFCVPVVNPMPADVPRDTLVVDAPPDAPPDPDGMLVVPGTNAVPSQVNSEPAVMSRTIIPTSNGPSRVATTARCTVVMDGKRRPMPVHSIVESVGLKKNELLLMIEC
jgi:hypothetical protein